jgi:hypothetical protein
MPETYLSIFFLFKLRLGWLPVFAICLTTISGVLMPSRGIVAMWVALFVSWIYLRFFSFLYSQTVPGDLRDSFAFVSFFPLAIHPYVLPLSRWIDARRFWPAHSAHPVLPLAGSEVCVMSKEKFFLKKATNERLIFELLFRLLLRFRSPR